MTWVFWLAIAFLAYTAVGYVVLVYLVSKIASRPHHKASIEPTVAVIVVAHNQAEELRRKIENTLALDYPRDKFEIIVASDASTDGTVEMVEQYADRGVQLIEITEHRGKHFAQISAAHSTDAEVLVFTDVAIALEPRGIREIVSNFSDPEVGSVSSEDRVIDPGGENTYINMEMRLRRMESSIYSLVGLSGSFFAMRRSLCRDWHEDLSSDFFIALHTREQGLRAVVDPESLGIYGITTSERAEFRRKVRTIVHGLHVLFHHVHLLNPVRYGFFAVQLASHKLFRWVTPVVLLALLVSNCLLWNHGWFYRVCLIGQLGLYSLGIISAVFEVVQRMAPMRYAAFFVLAIGATVEAWIKFVGGEKYIVWQPTPRS